MKKFLLIVLAALLLFAGCAAKEPPEGGGAPEGGTPDEIEETLEITAMYLTVNGNKLEVTLAENSSVTALVKLLQEGDIVYTANDYGGFEKVGNIGHTLPRSDTSLTSEAGDVFLYQGNQICIFIGSNSYTYTRIGKINGYTASDLKTVLGTGAVQITISLNER